MNFLQLCQSAALNCGVSGTLQTTSGQIGSLGRIVQWVSDSWSELQALHDDWDWMRASNILGSGISVVPGNGQFNIQLGTDIGQVGVATDSFGKWDLITFRTYSTMNAIGGLESGGIGSYPIGLFGIGQPFGGNSFGGGGTDETFLDCIPFDVWRDAYMFGAMRKVRTRPVAIAIGPDQSLCLGPPPNGLYTVTGDFWIAPTLMVNDTDVPLGLPLRYHILVVWRAMQKYGYYESAADVLQRAEFEWNTMFRELEARRLPAMSFSGALA
jgi:hypothetical protein